MAVLLCCGGARGEDAPGGFAGFLTGGRMDVKLRSFFMDRTFDPTYFFTSGQEQEALAAGGWFDWSTGRWHGIGFGVSVYASQKIYGPPDKGGTNLLAPGQQSFAVLGQAWMEATAGQTTARLYRQKIDTPFLNFRDNKMAPFTFEAYTLENRDVPGLLATLSYVTRVKGWSDTQFRSLGEAAGWETESAVTMAGLDWRSPRQEARVQAWGYHVASQYDTFYGQADGTIPLGQGLSTTLSAQWIQQRGQESGANGPFRTWMWGALGTLNWRGCQVGYGFTDTSNGWEVINPWGGYPGFTSIMEEDNNLAGERAWLLTATVDFGVVGIPGLKAHWDRTKSYVSTNLFGQSKKDQFENDVTIDYAFGGALQGFTIRGRAAWVRSSVSTYVLSGQDYTDYRLILNYDLPLAPLLRR